MTCFVLFLFTCFVRFVFVNVNYVNLVYYINQINDDVYTYDNLSDYQSYCTSCRIMNPFLNVYNVMCIIATVGSMNVH